MEIMIGDFNEWVPVRNLLCRVHNFFGKSPALRTFPSFMPVLPLDRIWVRPMEVAGEHVDTQDAAESKGFGPFAGQGLF